MPIEIKNLKGEVIFVYEGDTLVGADLSKKKLKEADFRNQDLTRINLEYAYCRGCDFSGAIMKEAYAPYAQLMECKFQGTDVEGINIERAKFFHSDLRGIKNWDKVKRDLQAKFGGAIMPDGTKVEEEE